MKRILVALDRSTRAAAVLAKGIEQARAAGAKLRLLRAVELPTVLPSSVLVGEQQRGVDDALSAGRRDLEDLASTVPAELVDGVDVIVGTPWDAICATAREYDVDLVVMGARAYGLVDRVLGTTVAKVVNHLDRSLLLVREPLANT